MKQFKKLLIATDFSELSTAAIEFGRSLISRYKAKLYIIHVVDNLPTMAMRTTELTADTVAHNAETRAKKELKNFIAPRLKGMKNVSTVVKIGEAHEEIVNFAKKQKVDLIVLATHGRTGLAHVLIGSVAEKVVRHSPVPVLTVKPAGLR